MSIMAWGMAALCAWVLLIAATYAQHLKVQDSNPYNTSSPIAPKN
jgi:hypothetical protein